MLWPVKTLSWIQILLIVAIFASGSWLYSVWTVPPLGWVAPLPPSPDVGLGRRASIRIPNYRFVTRVATLHDELFAYLMYQYYQKLPVFQDNQLLLYYSDQQHAPEYRIDLVLSDDLIDAVDRVAELNSRKRIERFEWELVPPITIKYRQTQTKLFEAAYNLPVRRKMEDLSRTEVRGLLRRFIRFKSNTDPRVRKGLEPVPRILRPGDAQQLASDIVDIARFYDLPLDIFLGIGAMENNYMDIRGDLENSVWKARPAKDDIVLERRKGRVRVLNDSAGRWQITRETLRYVHQLYLQDKRDYNQLPARLRPSRDLDVNHVNPDVLTTYAGLLLRELLDHFNGDAGLAAGAYNGGTANPNMRYEAGVQAAAEHARSVLERAAALNGESVMRMRWFSSH